MQTVRSDHWPLSLTGSSAAADRARAAFAAATASAAPALIVADRGLDAAAIAHVLHERSRPGTPLVVINCAAANEDVDRQLFGKAARGPAHAELETIGADSALMRAKGGTLYLQQILELPATTQRRLARVLRDREVSAGGRRSPVRARVVADAPASVATDVRDGQLRSDLFRRISQICIPVPSLRERQSDIPEVVETIVTELRGGTPLTFTQAALTVLSAAAWPGNLDELRSVLERIVQAAPEGSVRQEDVLAHLPIDGAFARIAPHVSLREARQQFEREYIASVLERHRWSMSEAARTLGIERANLYRKTRQLGIMRRSTRVAS
jgi:two-component system nitrogen regulation response regulator NtrX